MAAPSDISVPQQAVKLFPTIIASSSQIVIPNSTSQLIIPSSPSQVVVPSSPSVVGVTMNTKKNTVLSGIPPRMVTPSTKSVTRQVVANTVKKPIDPRNETSKLSGNLQKAASNSSRTPNVPRILSLSSTPTTASKRNSSGAPASKSSAKKPSVDLQGAIAEKRASLFQELSKVMRDTAAASKVASSKKTYLLPANKAEANTVSSPALQNQQKSCQPSPEKTTSLKQNPVPKTILPKESVAIPSTTGSNNPSFIIPSVITSDVLGQVSVPLMPVISASGNNCVQSQPGTNLIVEPSVTQCNNIQGSKESTGMVIQTESTQPTILYTVNPSTTQQSSISIPNSNQLYAIVQTPPITAVEGVQPTIYGNILPSVNSVPVAQVQNPQQISVSGIQPANVLNAGSGTMFFAIVGNQGIVAAPSAPLTIENSVPVVVEQSEKSIASKADVVKKDSESLPSEPLNQLSVPVKDNSVNHLPNVESLQSYEEVNTQELRSGGIFSEPAEEFRFEEPRALKKTENDTSSRTSVKKLDVEAKQPGEVTSLKQPQKKTLSEKRLKEKTPLGKQPQGKTPVEKQPQEKALVMKQPEEKTLVVKQPKEKTPMVKQPQEKTPAAKQPQEKTPAAKQPLEKTPVAKQPREKTPVVKQPQEKTLVAKQPQEKTPVVKQPQEKRPVVKQPQKKAPLEKKSSEKKRSNSESMKDAEGPPKKLTAVDVVKNQLKRVEGFCSELPPKKSHISVAPNDCRKLSDMVEETTNRLKNMYEDLKSFNEINCSSYIPVDKVDTDRGQILCRLCAGFFKREALIPLYKIGCADSHLVKMLNSVMPESMHVQPLDGLPQDICKHCSDKLIGCHQIINGFLDADKKLREILGLQAKPPREELPKKQRVREEAKAGKLTTYTTSPQRKKRPRDSSLDGMTSESGTQHQPKRKQVHSSSERSPVDSIDYSRFDPEYDVGFEVEWCLDEETIRSTLVTPSEEKESGGGVGQSECTLRTGSGDITGEEEETPIGNTEEEVTEDKLVEPAGDNLVEPAGDNLVEPAGDELIEAAEDKLVEPAEDKLVEPAGDKLVEPAGDKLVEPAGDKLVEPADDKLVEPAGDKLVEPAGDKLVEPAGDKHRESAEDKLVEPADDKHTDSAEVEHMKYVEEEHVELGEDDHTEMLASADREVSSDLSNDPHLLPTLPCSDSNVANSIPETSVYNEPSLPSDKESISHKVPDGETVSAEQKEEGDHSDKQSDERQAEVSGPTQNSFECDQCELTFLNEYSYFIHKSVVHDNIMDSKSLSKYKSEVEEKKRQKSGNISVKSGKMVMRTPTNPQALYNDGKFFKCGTGMLWVDSSRIETKSRIFVTEPKEIKKKKVHFNCDILKEPALSTAFVICDEKSSLQYDFLHQYEKDEYISSNEILGQNMEHKCKECNYVFLTVESLNDHIPSHLSPDCLCNICGVVMISEKKLKQHKKEHMQSLPYTCQICGKGFPNERTLKVHRAIHFCKKGPYVCVFCKKHFYFRINFKRHMASHAPQKPVKCSICFRTLKSRMLLHKHLALHRLTKCFDCCLCNKLFSSWNGLIEHRRQNHKLKNVISSKQLVDTKEASPFYQCIVCCKVLESKGSLLKHISFHKSDWPFHCFLCSRSYASKDFLKQHKCNLQSGAGYQCTYCGNLFSRKKALKIHKSLHNFNRQHVCLYCGRAFRFYQSLFSHILVHGGKYLKCPRCQQSFKSKGDLWKHHGLKCRYIKA